MHKRMPVEEKLEIVRLYVEEGKSSEEIARLMGRTGAGVRKVLREYGVKMRPAAHQMNPVITEEMKKNVIELCQSHTIADVAAEVGIGTTTVTRMLREAGVSLFVGRKIR